MDRRTWIKTGMLMAGSSFIQPGSFPVEGRAHASREDGMLMTVNGLVAPDDAGLVLPHEHVMSIFGLDPAIDPDYDAEKLQDAVVPYLRHIKGLGCGTVIDCTAAYFGRDPGLLKTFAGQTGLHIITNTGYYGAANDRYVPEHAFRETVDELTGRWHREWQDGIGDTGIRPGFMKVGVDGGPLSEIDAKLVRAGARLHLMTGLTLAVHTGNNPAAAQEQLAILKQEGVSPEAWIWVHAHGVEQMDDLVRAAEEGAWLEFDGLGAETIARHLELVSEMKRRGFLNQVLLSHDGNSFTPGERPPRPYEALFTTFIPALKNAGFSDEEVNLLTRKNPGRAFGVRVRPRR